MKWAALLALAAVLTACTTLSVTPSASDEAGDLVVGSSAFPEGGSIPADHTCDGQDLSPALNWSGAPAETLSYALIVDDPDAGGFIHCEHKLRAFNGRGSDRCLHFDFTRPVAIQKVEEAFEKLDSDFGRRTARRSNRQFAAGI